MSSIDDGGQDGTFWDAGREFKPWRELSNEVVKISVENIQPDSLEAGDIATKTNASNKLKENACLTSQYGLTEINYTTRKLDVYAVRDSISGSNGKSTESDSSKKKPKHYPFVIASLDEIGYFYLVVGVNGAAQYVDISIS
ncbi:uncharacterized protein MELLADRAFT_114274 [Melampsora larici-populina 98AG31]|uniref:Uncharacterized protein n=1 Tax=Melampsora larici-populina (strain 98AG31 / pathotype 3-4-7) TaxID=747676 RepID=F4SCV8_MELLP|nr:uncharacterized protein MELLADRAFT_114274 [Melampsora larici-populina 98AG31]EGF97519.1 hypothetical protein MELLADRAFT_114274 [Melampsora larici-populina 98AG31]